MKIIIIGMLLLLSPSIYADGNEAAHGGDGKAIDFERTKLDLQTLKTNTSVVVSKVNLHAINREWYPDAWQLLSQKTVLIEDIESSPYVIAEPGNPEKPSECLDQNGVRQHATTYPKKNSPICFDLEKISEDALSIAQIVALALHEHAHHFDFNESAANRIGAYVEIIYPQYAQHVTAINDVNAFIEFLPKPMLNYIFSIQYYFAQRLDESMWASKKIAFDRSAKSKFDAPDNLIRLILNGASAEELIPQGLHSQESVGSVTKKNSNELIRDVNMLTRASEIILKKKFVSPFDERVSHRPVIEVLQYNYNNRFLRLPDGQSKEDLVIIKSLATHFTLQWKKGENFMGQLTLFMDAFDQLEPNEKLLIKGRLKKLIFQQHNAWFWQDEIARISLNQEPDSSSSLFLQFDNNSDEGECVNIEDIKRVLREIITQ